MNFDAVLFDLDGTLVHTTHLYQEACIHSLAEMGLKFTQEDFERLYPAGTYFHEWIVDFGGTEAMLPEARVKRDGAYVELLRQHSEYIDGAEELFGFLGKHPAGIITGSWRSYVDAIDEKLKISKHVPLIVTATETQPYHKPHPHGLFLAADTLEVDPERCIYIGDSRVDMEAAKAAGMTSCFIRGPHSPKGLEKDADIAVQSMSELLEVL